MTPHRIQLSRRKGWRLPPNTINVARPTQYGNPHRIGWCALCGAEHTREEAIAEFEAEIRDLPTEHFAPLRGKDLACWCAPGDPCHADVLLRVANAELRQAAAEVSACNLHAPAALPPASGSGAVLGREK